MTEETHKHIIYIHLLIYVPTHMYIHNIKRMCLYIVHPIYSSVLLLSCIVFVLVLDNLGVGVGRGGNDLTNNPCVYSTRQKTSPERGCFPFIARSSAIHSCSNGKFAHRAVYLCKRLVEAQRAILHKEHADIEITMYDCRRLMYRW